MKLSIFHTVVTNEDKKYVLYSTDADKEIYAVYPFQSFDLVGVDQNDLISIPYSNVKLIRPINIEDDFSITTDNHHINIDDYMFNNIRIHSEAYEELIYKGEFMSKMTLYTLTYCVEGIGIREICSTFENINPLIHILNSQKIKFKVSDRSGPLNQNRLDMSDMQYWLNPEDSFDKDIITNVSNKDKKEPDIQDDDVDLIMAMLHKEEKNKI